MKKKDMKISDSLSEKKMVTVDLQLLFTGIIALTCTGFLIYMAKIVLLPFTLAIFLTYILVPVVNNLIKYKFPKIIAIFLSLVTTALFLIFIGLIAYQGTKDFRKKLPHYEKKFWRATETVIKHSKVLPIDLKNFEWREQINVNYVTGFIFSSLGNFMSFLAYTLLTFIFLLFILLEMDRFPNKIIKAFGEENGQTILEAASTINEKVHTYIIFKTIISAITGILVWLMLKYFHIDFALLWGLTAFLLNFIPNIGSTVAGIPPILITFIQYEALGITFKVFVGFTLIQIIIGQILDPKFVGEGLNISPIVILASLVIWGWLWGPVGMLICIPMASVIRIICEQIPRLSWISAIIVAR